MKCWKRDENGGITPGIAAESTADCIYEIWVQEQVDPHWSAWLQGMEIQHGTAGMTRFRGTVADQSALHGLLARIRDMQLTLVSLQRVGVRLENPSPED